MECVQVLVDTSERTPPRGFSEFDRDQLDPVRREYMRKLRVRMLDFNEEYLSKHPQVEALLRLMVMEVVCHKPYDVRSFIKGLLMSDSLETRVAKIILSKRINLERSHTREYFSRVAEWEYKSAPGERAALERSEWPEPRPRRPIAAKDKPGYSHLHYFKDPYWLYPKEFMTVNEKDGDKDKTDTIPKLPKWASDFLKVDFLTKWGDDFHDVTEAKAAKDSRKHKVCESSHIRKLVHKIRECKKTKKMAKEEKEIQARLVAETKRFKGDIRETNRAQILNCPTCKIALREDDYAGRSRTTLGTQGTSMFRPSKVQLENIVDELEEEWTVAGKTRVGPGEGGGTKDETGEVLKAVRGVLGGPGSDLQLSAIKMPAVVKRCDIKKPGDEITFLIPEGQLQIDAEDMKKCYYDVTDKEVPQMYKRPFCQIMLPKTGEKWFENKTSE